MTWTVEASEIDGLKLPCPLSGVFHRKSLSQELIRLKVRDIINRLEADGWLLVRTRGSHRQFRHPYKRGTVTVAGHPGVEIPPGTLKSILKQAELI